MWHQVWTRWGTVLLVTAIVVPLWVVFTVVMARRRDRPWRDTVTESAAVAGTAPWLWMILSPTNGQRSVSSTPFADLAQLWHASPATQVIQLGGNLLVFAAAAFCLPIRFRLRPRHVGLLGLAASIVVETVQYVADIGRVSSVDDVIVNTTGAYAAAWLSRRWWRSA